MLLLEYLGKKQKQKQPFQSLKRLKEVEDPKVEEPNPGKKRKLHITSFLGSAAESWHRANHLGSLACGH
jgi:hypothetical protein